MAYMSQEKKRSIHAKLKPILRKYGMKGTLSVQQHSTLTLTLSAGPIDFIAYRNPERFWENKPGVAAMLYDSYNLSINPFWYHEHFVGLAKQFLSEVLAVMNEGNHDRSDPMTDYFDVGWYVNVEVGRWNKPYQVAA